MDDRVLRELRFRFLLNDRTRRFIAGFFAARNMDALLRFVPDAFDGRLLQFNSDTDEHGRNTDGRRFQVSGIQESGSNLRKSVAICG